MLKKVLSTIINVDISQNQWIQASLPTGMGGLGVRRVSLLAPSAFLASAAGTRVLQDTILDLPSRLVSEDAEIESAQAMWPSLSACDPPAGAASHAQHSWDIRVCRTIFDSLLNSQTDEVEKARLLAVSAEHSSDWLHALPLSACGLRLDNESLRVSVGLRLGSRLCEPHRCPCGSMVDSRGLHGLACKKSSGRLSRHQYLNDIIWRAFNKAGVPSVKEPNGLMRSDGKRPDGLTQIPWEMGKLLAWDVTVTDTLAASYVRLSSATAGAAAEKAADKKAQKYAELAASYAFVPLAFETLGPMNRSGAEVVRRIGVRTRSPGPRSDFPCRAGA